MIKYIRTQQNFDISLMQKEVSELSEDFWKLHYNKSHYDGDWSVLPLRSLNGSLENTVATHAPSSGLVYKNTLLLEACPYLHSVISSFECEKTSVRLMKLKAGARIKEHTDHDMNLEAGEARFHIPVFTHADVAFYIMQERIPMLEGECWYLNLSLPHSVYNESNTDRIHLVIDCLANDWVKALLHADGLTRQDIASAPVQQTFSKSDEEKIIAALRNLNTPAALQMIEAMQSGEQQAQQQF